ncbi:hypothetical protein NLU03_14195 [Bacillus toyonensis]|nr:hypothetical protein [Bacillus toyonensis]MDT3495126.1 hypothetical protein [Bacillus toyonensis]MDT3495439.1 hypothetical protein [Bacillus toyonensis]MDT3495533.1 hypothetical protein [Bacillus toyonensis]
MRRKVYDRQFKIAAVQLILEENMFAKVLTLLFQLTMTQSICLQDSV